MSNHNSSEAMTTSRSDHVQELHPLERRRAEHLPNLQPVGSISTTKFSNKSLRLALSLRNHSSTRPLTAATQRGNMPTLSPRSLAAGPVVKTNLNSIVAVFLF
jgi:hypothetical protein